MKRRKPQPKPERPEKPTKNGHYMGLTCGFEFEDGRYRIAQSIHARMDALIAEQESIRVLMSIQNDYFTKRLELVSQGMRDWWERVKTEYGIQGEFSYSGGWLTPLKESEPSRLPCTFCGTPYAQGEEAIKHRTECPKDPFAAYFRASAGDPAKESQELS